MGVWTLLKPVRPAVHVPVGWAPILERIPRVQPQDIDVLFYGGLSQERITTLNLLGLVSTVFACNLFGSGRDNLIARSKIVLNINRNSSRIFGIVRASYLLANAKAVVSDKQVGTYIEDDMRDAVVFAKLSKIAAVCQYLLKNENLRQEIEKRGQIAIRKRDIRAFLSRVLNA
jgi:hypothetical protein